MARRRRLGEAVTIALAAEFGILPVLAAGLPRGPVGQDEVTVGDDVGRSGVLLLEVVVNGHRTGAVGAFERRGGVLCVDPEEWQRLGFRLPAAIADRDRPIDLASLAGLHVRVDGPTQTAYITASDRWLRPALLHVGTPAEAAGIPVESGSGATLNYDINATASGGRNGSGGLFGLRGFAPGGVASSTWLAFAGSQAAQTPATVRLDTTFEQSDPETLRRWRLGDVIADGSTWSRPVRLGGIQITKDFSMRPDLVTFPVPTLGGSVAVPSTVDVLVNGTRLLSQPLQPGPFVIPQIPVVTGAGQVSMTVTNALGQQVTTTLPFYASTALLARGLQSYSFQAGWVRRAWGLVSNDYGPPAASGSWRRGVSDRLTVDAHAEATAGLFLAGGGGAMNVGNFGIANLDLAASAGAGRSGGQIAVGMQRLSQRLSLSAAAIVASAGYRDIAAMNGEPVARWQLNASAGMTLGRSGTIGVAFTGIDRPAAQVTTLAVPSGDALPVGLVAVPLAETKARIVSATYSVPLRGASFYLTGFHDAAPGGGSGVMLGVTIPLGPRNSASVSATSGDSTRYAQFQAMQSAVKVGDWGYQVYGVAGTTTHQFGQVQYKSPWALVTAGADRIAGRTTLRAEAQGAVSFIAGSAFASNAIDDSFAVVDTSGVGNVRVYDENREVGRTDRAGQLLVPDLRAFELNHLSINPDDVPLDTAVPFVSRVVRPQDRSGVVVEFPLRPSRSALVSLVDAAGRPLPLGSVAMLRPGTAGLPVGHAGQVYVEELGASNTLDVVMPDGRRCHAEFGFRAVPGQIPAIGPVVCRGDDR